jgi:hypothetical protein
MQTRVFKNNRKIFMYYLSLKWVLDHYFENKIYKCWYIQLFSRFFKICNIA